MGVFFVYILKSAVCLAGFYLFYRLLLSRETFHRFNRMALLGLLVLSCLIPLLEVTVHRPTGMERPFLTLEEMLLLSDMVSVEEAAVVTPAAFTWREGILLVYLLGIGFFLVRNLWSLGRMLRLIRGSKMQKREDGITLITHRRQIAPFSWMRYIVISEKDLEENGLEILTHELAHIRNGHSIDLLVADVCIFLQWFNPAAWLLKQELQNIHEYEADESVMAQGIDAKSYQLLIIKKAVGTRLYSMANSFNHSSLKKRITMMMKKKSNPWARAKFLYVLPLAAVAVAAFARPEVSNELKEISAVKVNDLTAIVKAEEVKSVETVAISDEKTVKVKGKVLYADTMEPIASASILIKGTNSGTLTDAEGNFAITAPAGATLSFSYIGLKTSEIELKKDFDAENLSLNVMMGELSKSYYSSIKYDKETQSSSYTATVKYDQREEEQTFQVVEQMPEFPGGMPECMKWLGQNVRYPKLAQENKIEGRVILQFVVEKDGSIGEVKVVRGVSPELDAEAQRVVASMPKWKPGMQKGKAVRVKYTFPFMFRLQKQTPSDGASDSISTMTVNVQKNAMGALTVRGGNIDTDAPTLIMIDGKKSDYTAMSKLDLKQIESLTVLKDKEALARYGEEGKNGVIFITTKK